MIAQAQHRPTMGSVGDTLLRILRFREASIAVVAIAIAIIFQLINSNFLSTTEIEVLLAGTAQYGFFALGEAMLMITGEIDLSAAKIFSTVPFIAYYLNHDAAVPMLIALIVALVGAALIGMANGIITVVLGLPSLIATLGMLFFLNGVTLWVTKSQPVTTPDAGQINTFLGQGQTNLSIGGPATIAGFLWLLFAAAVLAVLLLRTRFGLHTVSVGSNLLAAREIGIRTQRVKIINFMIMGLVAGFGGIIQMYVSGTIDPTAGDNTLTLYGIAAAVIGGTSLFGGSGTIVGAVIGAFVISSLNNGLPLVGAQAGVSDAILGAAIAGAMILNIRLGKLQLRRRAR